MTDIRLHPEDILNLADVRARARYLFGMRKTMGWAVKDMQQGNGYAHGYIARMLGEDKYPWDWKWSTYTNLGEALGFIPGAEVSGFVLAPTPMLALGAQNPTFQAVGLLESMRKVRDDLGISAVQFGRKVGISDTTVGKIENSDNPKLVSLMRYARGLNGRVRFVIKEN